MSNVRRQEQRPHYATAADWNDLDRQASLDARSRAGGPGRVARESTGALRNRVIALENELTLLRNELARRFGTEDA